MTFIANRQHSLSHPPCCCHLPVRAVFTSGPILPDSIPSVRCRYCSFRPPQQGWTQATRHRIVIALLQNPKRRGVACRWSLTMTGIRGVAANHRILEALARLLPCSRPSTGRTGRKTVAQSPRKGGPSVQDVAVRDIDQGRPQFALRLGEDVKFRLEHVTREGAAREVREPLRGPAADARTPMSVD